MNTNDVQNHQIPKVHAHALEGGAAAFQRGLMLNPNPYAASDDKNKLSLCKAWEFE
jgi:hypothetical protein